jgi:response regulator NasT
MCQLEETVRELEGQLEVRKVVDRAKGRLIDNHGMSEQDAFAFIQQTAMSGRSTMLDVANRVVDGLLEP